MTEAVKREKVIDKLAKLKRMAESAGAIGNEAEAQAFAEKFQRMLFQHRIEEVEINLADEPEDVTVDNHHIDYTKYPDVEVKKTRSNWSERLANIVAQAHFCEFFVYPGTSRISFLGRKSDAAVAEFAYITLYRATRDLAKAAHGKFAYECYKRDGHCMNARGFKESFIVGFITRLAQRYADVKRAVVSSSSTALVVINQSKAAINDWKEENKSKKASALTRSHASNSEGYRRGMAEADKIKLDNRAVTATNVKGVLRG